MEDKQHGYGLHDENSLIEYQKISISSDIWSHDALATEKNNRTYILGHFFKQYNALTDFKPVIGFWVGTVGHNMESFTSKIFCCF